MDIKRPLEDFSTFPELYMQKDKIKEAGTYEGLTAQNHTALDIVEAIKLRDASAMQRIASQRRESSDIRLTLEWMLETGCNEDGLDNEYSEVLDVVSIYLARKYKQRKYLPEIAEMIFRRHRRGAFMHDLAWAFFEACYPYSLIMIAKHLNSCSDDDIKLACRLLNFVPGLHPESRKNFTFFLKWFNENSPFLRYTGESFQQKPGPRAYEVCLGAKYLCKPVNPANGEPIEPFSEEEKGLEKRFDDLDGCRKNLVANYSYNLFCSYPDRWKEWIRCPIDEQVRIAGLATGGTL